MNKKLTQLREVLVELDATLVVTKADNLHTTLEKVFKQNHITSLALSNDTIVSKAFLVKDWKGSGLSMLRMPKAGKGIETWREKLAETDAGITGAVGIAVETGTALLPTGDPDPRQVSLLPLHHIMLIEKKNVVDNVAALFELWANSDSQDRNAIFVSGPSRTADIEKELVLGVHGPGKVTVIIIE